MTSPTLSPRPLSVLERSCWHVDQVASHNLLTIAEVDGPLREEEMRKGLDLLQRRYPLLGVQICSEGRRLVFRGGQVPAIPLRVMDVSKDAWCEVAEQELNLSLSGAAGPLARCVLLRHEESRNTILFTFLHAIGDGYSGFFLLRDLFRFLAGTDNANLRDEPREVPASLQAYLPREVRGVQGALRLVKMMGREMSGYLREGGMPKRLRLDSLPPHFLRKTRLCPVRFERDFTDRLVHRARREGTSVHGAVCAAGLLAVSSVMTDGSPRVLACTSAVDMRTRTEPPIGEEMGLFVSVLWIGQKVWKGKAFWELAREVREKLAGKIEAGDPAVVAWGGSLLLPLMERLPGENRSSRIVKSAEKIMYNFKGTGVSNVGKLEMPECAGDLSMRSLSFAGSLVNLGYFLAVVNTFNGRLMINYMVNDPLIARDRASRLVDAAASLLRRSVI